MWAQVRDWVLFEDFEGEPAAGDVLRARVLGLQAWQRKAMAAPDTVGVRDLGLAGLVVARGKVDRLPDRAGNGPVESAGIVVDAGVPLFVAPVSLIYRDPSPSLAGPRLSFRDRLAMMMGRTVYVMTFDESDEPTLTDPGAGIQAVGVLSFCSEFEVVETIPDELEADQRLRRDWLVTATSRDEFGDLSLQVALA